MALRSEYTPQTRKCNDGPYGGWKCAGCARDSCLRCWEPRSLLQPAPVCERSDAQMSPSPTEHPARMAGLNSVRNVKAKAKAPWLALCAEDAVIEDPVGVSPLDPSGQGHRGKEAIARFWDTVIAPGEVETRARGAHAPRKQAAQAPS